MSINSFRPSTTPATGTTTARAAVGTTNVAGASAPATGGIANDVRVASAGALTGTSGVATELNSIAVAAEKGLAAAYQYAQSQQV